MWLPRVLDRSCAQFSGSMTFFPHLQLGCAILPGWFLGLFRRPGGQSAVEGAAVGLPVTLVVVAGAVIVGVGVVVGADFVPPPPPVPPPDCASATPKDPQIKATEKVVIMMNLVIANLLPPVLLNSAE